MKKTEKKKEIKCPSCGKLLTSVYEYALDWWAGKCVKCKLNTVVYLPIVEEEQFAVYTKNDKGNLVINKKHPLYKELTGEAKKIADNENL